VPGFHLNPHAEFIIDKLCEKYEGEYSEVAETMKLCSTLRFRDLITETAQEFCRMENFTRIYPARNSKLYDKYFSSNKYLNKIIYKIFYTNEILSYDRIDNGLNSAHPKPTKSLQLNN